VNTIFGLLIVLSCGAGHCWSQCRQLTEVVNMKLPISDTISSTAATVVRFENDRDIEINAVRSLARPAFGNAHFSFAISRDFGVSWKWLEDPVPFRLLMKDLSMVEAPSDPRVRYKKTGFSYYRSRDGGKTWHILQIVLPRQSGSTPTGEESATVGSVLDLTLVAIHPRDPLTIFGSFRSIKGASQKWLQGVYVSHDGGDAWNEFATVLVGGNMLGISPRDPSVMLGLGRDGIMKTADGGTHWFKVSSLTLPNVKPSPATATKIIGGDAFWPEIHQVAFDRQNPGIVYLVSNLGLYRSQDSGESWCLLNLGFDILGGINSIAINSAQTNEIVVGTSLGVFWSQDKGNTFAQIYPNKRD